MACEVQIPQPTQECIDFWFAYNPFSSIGSWNGASSASCDIRHYLGTEVYSDQQGSLILDYTNCNQPETPPSDSLLPEETLVTGSYSGLGSECDITGATLYKEATTRDRRYDYRWIWSSSSNCWIISYNRLRDFDIYAMGGALGICEIGGEFDPIKGYCVPLPGYEEDPENPGFFIPITCFRISGPDLLCEKKTYTYKIYNINYGTQLEEVVPEDIMIHISYPFGSAKNNLDFTAPYSAVIKKDESYVNINLVLLYNETKDFNILLEPEEGASCDGLYHVDIFCSEDDDGIPIPSNQCCAYVPKDYIAWVEDSAHTQWMTCHGFKDPEYL